MRSTPCNGNALFVETKLYELYSLYNENKGLNCGELVWRNMAFSKTWLQKYYFSPLTKAYARESARKFLTL